MKVHFKMGFKKAKDWIYQAEDGDACQDSCHKSNKRYSSI